MTIEQLTEALTPFKGLGLPLVVNLGRNEYGSGREPVGVGLAWAYRYRSSVVENQWHWNGGLENGPTLYFEDDDDVEVSLVVNIEGDEP